MVMMMTTTKKKSTAPLDVPVLPSADDYRDGMDKMRAKINCPVLSKEEQVLASSLGELRAHTTSSKLSADAQALADELLEFDATAQSKSDVNDARLHIESEQRRFNDSIDLCNNPRPHYDFGRTTKTSDDLPPVDRLNVAEYLKEQYQTNMLARYPNFEATTENDIAMLKLKMDQMFVFNTVIAMFLGVLLVLGFWLIFLMV